MVHVEDFFLEAGSHGEVRGLDAVVDFAEFGWVPCGEESDEAGEAWKGCRWWIVRSEDSVEGLLLSSSEELVGRCLRRIVLLGLPPCVRGLRLGRIAWCRSRKACFSHALISVL